MITKEQAELIAEFMASSGFLDDWDEIAYGLLEDNEPRAIFAKGEAIDRLVKEMNKVLPQGERIKANFKKTAKEAIE